MLSSLTARHQTLISTPCRSPDDAKIKQKMLYASSKDALRRALVGIAVEIQGTEYDEVAWEVGECPVCPPVRVRAISYMSLLVIDKASRGS